MHLSNVDLKDNPGAYFLKSLSAGDVYSYKSAYKIKVCSMLNSKAIVSVASPSGTNSCQLTEEIHHGEFKVKNEATGKFLNADCWFSCGGGTNVDLYDDIIAFSNNRIFELKSQGSGVHWLKIAHSSLWVAQWVDDSVKLGTETQRDKFRAASSWHLLCNPEVPNRCSFKNVASGECLVATGDSNNADVAVAPCEEGNRLQMWNLVQ